MERSRQVSEWGYWGGGNVGEVGSAGVEGEEAGIGAFAGVVVDNFEEDTWTDRVFVEVAEEWRSEEERKDEVFERAEVTWVWALGRPLDGIPLRAERRRLDGID